LPPEDNSFELWRASSRRHKARSAFPFLGGTTKDGLASTMGIMPERLRRNHIIGLAVGCLAVLLLAVGVHPSWGEEGTGTPLALGYVNSDGETSVVQLTAAEPLGQGSPELTVLGVPAEPEGHQLVRLTNARRANQGLPPLKAAWELMDAGQYHSEWMASHNCFDHNCPGEPDWKQRILNAGYSNYTHLGENIAAGHPTAGDAVQAWMKSSEGHRENMLSADFREAGGGYAYSANSDHHHYWTMDFGARNEVFPVVINQEAWSTPSLDVELYVYGQGWAEEMRFRNEGGTWSEWETYSCNKAWTLSMGTGSPTVVYAQIKRGSTVLGSSDEIHLDIELAVTPDQMVFLWPTGSSETTPSQYSMHIDAAAGWTATANREWIKVSQALGSGPATVTVNLEDFPQTVGVHTGIITVESPQMTVEVLVSLSVTEGALQEGYVPLMSRG